MIKHTVWEVTRRRWSLFILDVRPTDMSGGQARYPSHDLGVELLDGRLRRRSNTEKNYGDIFVCFVRRYPSISKDLDQIETLPEIGYKAGPSSSSERYSISICEISSSLSIDSMLLLRELTISLAERHKNHV